MFTKLLLCPNLVLTLLKDPMVPQEASVDCGSCRDNGYSNYVGHDPVYKSIELWTEGGEYSELKGHESPDVRVEVYYETGHPHASRFLSGDFVLLMTGLFVNKYVGTLASVLQKRDIRDIIDFKILPHVRYSLYSIRCLDSKGDRAIPRTLLRQPYHAEATTRSARQRHLRSVFYISLSKPFVIKYVLMINICPIVRT
jgi:hypothetical protein